MDEPDGIPGAEFRKDGDGIAAGEGGRGRKREDRVRTVGTDVAESLIRQRKQ